MTRAQGHTIIRSVQSTVSLSQSFALDGIDGVHAPGTYDVFTDEELIQDLSFMAWRRVATFIYLPKNGAMQMHRIDPAELDAIQVIDSHSRKKAMIF